MPLQHFTVLADAIVGQLTEGFTCRPGKAFVAMKVWANSTQEAADKNENIGSQIGFQVDGKIDIFQTPPIEMAKEKPFGYDIQFTPYQ